MRRLYRDRWDKKVAGVCGGLGQFLKLDPTIIRLLVIFLCVITGLLPFLIIYVVIWILIPLGPRIYIEIKCKKIYLSDRDKKIAGVCAGIARRFNFDPNILRLITILALFITGFFPILITYFVGILVIPKRYNP